MRQGWVKLFRKSLDNGWLKNHALWTFWTYCLLKATHINHTALIGNQEVVLKPGQFVFGRRIAAKELKMSEKQIRNRLTFLENSGNVTIKRTNKYSIITIVNWNTYQGGKHQKGYHEGQQGATKGPHTRMGKNEEEIYAHYLSAIDPLKKSKQRALNNIHKLLKKHSIDDLQKSISNYQSTLNGTQPQFRKDPANFFGINEPYFIDFLPGNFEPSTKQDLPIKFEWSPKDDER